MEDKNSNDLFFNQYTDELDHLNKLFKNTDQSEQKKIIIVHTNDIHGRIEQSNESMGYAAISAKVNQLRKMNETLLLVDVGDTFHGQPIAQIDQGKSILNLLNTMGYDAMVAGNHDFNFGYERLLELNNHANFPILCANVFNNQEQNILPQSTIIYREGLRIGLIGISTPETAYETHPKNIKDLRFESPVKTTQKIVDQLKEQTDIIIVLSHLGINGTSKKWTSIYLAKNVDGIDLIVDGHSHSSFKKGLMVHETMIASAGEFGKALGIVELTLENNTIVNRSAKQHTIHKSLIIQDDQDVQNQIEDTYQQLNKIMNEEILQLPINLNGKRKDVRTGQTTLGNVITKAMITTTNADIALINGGGIRDSLTAGMITKKDLLSVLPFNRKVVTIKIKGSMVKEMIEHGLNVYPVQSGAFPHIAGLAVQFDSSKAPGRRVQSIIIDEEPLDYEKEYIMATNEFLAAGGDAYTMLMTLEVLETFDTIDSIFANWLIANGAEGARIDHRLVDSSKTLHDIMQEAI